eukprot:jgi/Botrbrau1/17018/Bobra.49_2s0075.2
MGRSVTLACTQMSCSWETEDNLELFETPYFPQRMEYEHYKLARPFEDNPVLARFSSLAKELGVVLPISYYEKANNAHYNSIAVYDADGSCVGRYRKSHIPDGPGYSEKMYFNVGDTGFKVFNTKFAKIGVAICWDQWFPEAARAMALQGAEVLFYPTAIGSEPQDPTLNSYPHWARVMTGHAGANLVPVVASNRIGTEDEITFYGGSFICDHKGAILEQIGKKFEGELIDLNPEATEGVALATVDLDEIGFVRASWGIFRDRRPDLYEVLLTLDGTTHSRRL